MPITSIPQEKPISSRSESTEAYHACNMELDMRNLLEGFGNDGHESFFKRRSSSGGEAHRRRTPTPLVLSPSNNSERNIQLTAIDHTLLSNPTRECITVNHYELPLRRSSTIRQSSSAHHVKMGIRHSCPRTPLKSAGSSPGLNPNVSRWQESQTEYDSSIQSLRRTECIQHIVDAYPALILPSPKSLDLNLSLDRICRSPTSTVRTITSEDASEESSTSYSRSNYSNDSERDESPLQSPSSAALEGASISIKKSSSGNGNSPLLDLPSLSNSCTPPIAVEESNGPPEWSPGFKLMNAMSSSIKDSIGSIKNKRRANSTITPSPMIETTKTIQLRRSFGQLVLFQRPSQIQVSLAGKVLHSCNVSPSEDEEQEELHTECGNAQSSVGVKSFQTSSCGSRAIVGLNRLNRFKPDALEENDRSETVANDLLFFPDSSDQHSPDPTFSRDLNKRYVNNQATSRPGSIFGSPKGLLKLVKSHSSLREKFFHSRSQSCSPQHNQITYNLAKSSDRCGSNPEVTTHKCDPVALKVLKMSRVYEQKCTETIQLESQDKQALTKPDYSQSLSGNANVGSKKVAPDQLSSVKIFKFWKRKKVQNSTEFNIKEEATKTNSKDPPRNLLQPSHNNETRLPVQLLGSKSTRHAIPRLKSVPSLLSLSVKESKQKKSEFASSRARISPKNLISSPIRMEGRKTASKKLPAFEQGTRGGTIANRSTNLVKPPRPPRKIPVTMKTL